jgi:hypothetical protein
VPMGAFWARGREIGAETPLPSPHGCRLHPAVPAANDSLAPCRRLRMRGCC